MSKVDDAIFLIEKAAESAVERKLELQAINDQIQANREERAALEKQREQAIIKREKAAELLRETIRRTLANGNDS